MEAVVLLDVSGFISSQQLRSARVCAISRHPTGTALHAKSTLTVPKGGGRGAWGFRLFDGRSCGLGRTPLELSRLLKSLKLPYKAVARGSFSCLDANSAVEFANAVLQAARALRKDPSRTDRVRAIRRWVKDCGGLIYGSLGTDALWSLYGGHDMSSKGLLLRSIAECVIEFEHSKEERGNQTKGRHQDLQRILVICTLCPKSDEEWQSYNHEGDFINTESAREKITRGNCREEDGIGSSHLTLSSRLGNGLTRLAPILLKRRVEIICIDCQFNFRHDVVQAFRDSLRFVDGRLLDWRELGIGPWLLPIWDRRRQRESSGSKLIQREENAEEPESVTVKMPWGFEVLKLIHVGTETQKPPSLKHKMRNPELAGCMELRSVNAAAGGMGSDGSFLAHSNTPGWRTLLLALCRRGACAILRSDNEDDEEKVVSFDKEPNSMTKRPFSASIPSKMVEMSPTQPKASKQLPMGRATLPKLLEGVMGWFSYKGVSADDNSERAVPNKAMNHKRSTYEEGTVPPSFDSPVIITPEEEPQKSHEFWLLFPLTLSCASLRKIPKVWVGEQGLEELPFKPRGLPRVLQQSTVCRTATPGVSRAGGWNLLQDYFSPDKLKAANFLSVPHSIDDNTPATLLHPGGGWLQAESIEAIAATQRLVGLGEGGEREEAAKAVADVQGISVRGAGRMRGIRVKRNNVSTASSSGNGLHSPCSVLSFGKSESRVNKNSVNEGGSGIPSKSIADCSAYDASITPLPLLLGWLHTSFDLGAMAEQDLKGFVEEDSRYTEKWDALRAQLDQASDEYMEALKIGKGIMDTNNDSNDAVACRVANREKHRMDNVITEQKELETTHSGREPSSQLDEGNPEKRVCLQQVYDECLAIGEQGEDEDGLDYLLSKVNWLSDCDVADAERLIISVKALGKRHSSMRATAADRIERSRMRLKKVKEYQLQALLRLEVSSRREGQDPIRPKDMGRLKQILETLALDSASATAISLATCPNEASESNSTPFSMFMEEIVKRYSSFLPNTLSQVYSEFELSLPEALAHVIRDGEAPLVVEGAVGVCSSNRDRPNALSVENCSLVSNDSTSGESSSSTNKHTVCSSLSGSGGVLGKRSLLQRSLSGRFSQQRSAGGPKLCRVPSSLSGPSAGKKAKKQKRSHLNSTPVKKSRDNGQTTAPRTPCSFSTMLFVNESPMDDEVKQKIGGHATSLSQMQSNTCEERRATPRQKRVQRSVPETPV